MGIINLFVSFEQPILIGFMSFIYQALDEAVITVQNQRKFLGFIF